MKLSVSAYRAHASAHKKILSNSYQTQLNYGSTAAASISTTSPGFGVCLNILCKYLVYTLHTIFNLIFYNILCFMCTQF